MKKEKLWAVEVSYKQGVTDAVADTVKKGINDLGIKKVSYVRTVQKYIIDGNLSKEEIEKICKDLLANPVIQNFSFKRIG